MCVAPATKIVRFAKLFYHFTTAGSWLVLKFPPKGNPPARRLSQPSQPPATVSWLGKTFFILKTPPKFHRHRNRCQI